MEALETKKEELTEVLNNGIEDHDELRKVSEEFQKVSDELEEKEMRWLELSELA